MPSIILLRGGGDLASGVALRLHHAGLHLLITELAQPLVVRRLVSFAEAIYSREITIEDVTAERAASLDHALSILEQGRIPVLVDPQAASLQALRSGYQPGAYPDPVILVDGRMTKRPPDLGMDAARLVIGLGPGYVAGVNCHAVIETNRGHRMGRAIWVGAPEPDTGIPESVENHRSERVLRSPADGMLEVYAEIGDHLEAGQPVAAVAGETISAPFRGVLRGLLHSGLAVRAGAKVGDLDPRDDPLFCRLVSDKALAVGGGVLEALLSRPDLRAGLWS
ncbi:MAG TPA: selenium-dependent molybdenum cofactor biosynthesis protein YqeB [Anaerolineales bacterium]